MEQIHSTFGLACKLTATLMDNGQNFVKVFEMFESPASDSDEEGEDDQGTALT